MNCPNCGTENRDEARFCQGCGTTFAVTCPNGHPVSPTARFCDQCGSPVGTQPAQPTLTSVSTTHAPAAERRLVSILFADLVGFTTLSESRDVEEVRELLSGYFETCKKLISLYGGTVEKFIGDAVMAVWGAPIAQEDDAERAVRTALDLTAAVTALGQEVGAPELKARAGVLTGEAAVTLGAVGQGMVAGDLVNTASRIQAAAEPGTVLVGESTRRATDAAIAYEEAGSHELKGKSGPTALWRALRVIGGRRGALRSTGLEPPFVGRDRELRMVKDLFHGSSAEKKAHLVSVQGIAGIGKSRLSWEFFKYIDGLAEIVDWHRGRCLPYGEGVTYWALAEMVRMRAGIAEGEGQEEASVKLHEAVRDIVRDEEEQRWVEPRLSHLLGLEERTQHEREDLFAAWRLFLERMAERSVTVMVFEDLQWADPSMLDFIDYLLDWSRSHPIFVLTLSRPDLMDRRAEWGVGKRNFTPMYLEPLGPDSMEELLTGFVPGLPEELRKQILARAEGVPLYAVETIRMLLDRGSLVREGSTFQTTETVHSLEVPETLQALIAARLDGLTPDERRLVQDASVLGKTFTKSALSALSAIDEGALDPLLAALSRKEVFALQSDPRSPERGQYGFLQDLMKRVAYETLSKHERKSRHLAAARYLREAWGEDEDDIVEVIASHFLEAYKAVPDADDASDLKSTSGMLLRRAGERAAALGANEEAQRYFEQASELLEDPLARAELLERAGRSGWSAGRTAVAHDHFEKAIELFDSVGSLSASARVSGRLGELIWVEGHIDQAAERMERALDVLQDESDEDTAWLSAQLGRFMFFMGQSDRGIGKIESALQVAEALGLPEVMSEALNTKGLMLTARARPEEGLALIRHSLTVALDNDVSVSAQRAYFNLSNLLYYRDEYDEALRYADAGLALSRRFGERDWEWQFLANTVAIHYWIGRWDDALTTAEDIPRLEEIPAARFASVELLLALPPLFIARGQIAEARKVVDSFEAFAGSADEQERSSYFAGLGIVLRGEGNTEEALEVCEKVVFEPGLGESFAGRKLAVAEAFDAAVTLGAWKRAETLRAFLQNLPAGASPPYNPAQMARFDAIIKAHEGSPETENSFKRAVGAFREIQTPFRLGVTILEYAEWLAEAGRPDEASVLIDEADGIFTRLSAEPWVKRAAGVLSGWHSPMSSSSG